uniref:Uncharacterized protein n=1 Tax=Lutzomyia longipalpis TaxID=7200 RepID=A0A1B0CU01_LUTLO
MSLHLRRQNVRNLRHRANNFSIIIGISSADGNIEQSHKTLLNSTHLNIPYAYPTMERGLHDRDIVGLQDFVLLEDYQSEDAFLDNLKKRFQENLIYRRF